MKAYSALLIAAFLSCRESNPVVNRKTLGSGLSTNLNSPGPSTIIKCQASLSLASPGAMVILDGKLYERSRDAIDFKPLKDSIRLTGADATALYGSRAKNGVLLLSTKGSLSKLTDRQNIQFNSIGSSSLALNDVLITSDPNQGDEKTNGSRRVSIYHTSQQIMDSIRNFMLRGNWVSKSDSILLASRKKDRFNMLDAYVITGLDADSVYVVGKNCWLLYITTLLYLKERHLLKIPAYLAIEHLMLQCQPDFVYDNPDTTMVRVIDPNTPIFDANIIDTSKVKTKPKNERTLPTFYSPQLSTAQCETK